MKKVFILIVSVFSLVFLVSCDKEKPEKYSVLFYTNGGTYIETLFLDQKDVMIEEPANPTKEGFVFEEWYKDNALTEIWDFDVDLVTKSMVLYASWFVPNYTITYELNGGFGGETNPLVYNFSMGEISLVSPKKAGGLFRGWFKESDFSGTRILQLTKENITEDTTLYANWR